MGSSLFLEISSELDLVPHRLKYAISSSAQTDRSMENFLLCVK